MKSQGTTFTAIAAAGLSASRMRADVSAANLANKESASYKRRDVFQTALPIPLSEGSFSSTLDRQTLMKPSVYAILEDQSPPNMQYQPNHPEANAEGYVALPNVNIVGEMTNMMSALRLYQANLTAMEAGREMSSAARSLLTQA
ncbi:MAG: flagellar basal body rod protein FlgC [Pseudomonadota bacterium]|jgi:flagellar basal-body rod protein FlgC